MSPLRTRWHTVSTASALLAGAFAVANVHSALRVAVMLWFVLVCPGIAIVRRLGVTDGAAELALAVGLSVALAAAVAAIGLYTGLWAPGATLAILIAITIGAGAAPPSRLRRGARP
jgi:uncharacterized membrane protein